MTTPSQEEFLKGIDEYEKNEKRDPIYRVATFLMDYSWGKPSDMADALGVLLLTWNQAFYRYGSFDFDALDRCIAASLPQLEAFRERTIFSLAAADEEPIKQLFANFMKALQITTGNQQGKMSPVAAAKALHLLAPQFFPLWDKEIAKAYACNYVYAPYSRYVSFCKKMKELADKVKDYPTQSSRSVLKLLDEYNYAKFTKQWI